MDQNSTQQTENTQQTEKKSGKKPVIIVSIIGIIIVAALVAVIVTLLNREPVVEQVNRVANYGEGVIANEDNIDELLKKEEEEQALASYTTEMNSDWNFPDGSSPSTNAYVRNNESNSYPVYFDVRLTTDTGNIEDGELLYTSPKMPVKTFVKNMRLNKVLPAGTHEAVLTYHIIDDNDNELREVSVGIRLHIQS